MSFIPVSLCSHVISGLSKILQRGDLEMDEGTWDLLSETQFTGRLNSNIAVNIEHDDGCLCYSYLSGQKYTNKHYTWLS